MNKVNYKTIPINESPRLVMRYYKAEMPQKGILVFVHGVSPWRLVLVEICRLFYESWICLFCYKFKRSWRKR